MGVTHLPAAALAIIEADVLKGCARVVLRSVTGPRIGKAMSAALVAPAATQGLKGSSDPLTSSCCGPKDHDSVAGLTHSNEETPPNHDSPGGVVQPIKEAT